MPEVARAANERRPGRTSLGSFCVGVASPEAVKAVDGLTQAVPFKPYDCNFLCRRHSRELHSLHAIAGGISVSTHSITRRPQSLTKGTPLYASEQSTSTVDDSVENVLGMMAKPALARPESRCPRFKHRPLWSRTGRLRRHTTFAVSDTLSRSAKSHLPARRCECLHA